MSYRVYSYICIGIRTYIHISCDFGYICHLICVLIENYFIETIFVVQVCVCTPYVYLYTRRNRMFERSIFQKRMGIMKVFKSTRVVENRCMYDALLVNDQCSTCTHTYTYKCTHI